MSRRPLATATVLALGLTALAGPADPTAKERAELASTVYKDTVERTAAKILAPPASRAAANTNDLGERVLNAELAESLGLWSVRWLEAQTALASTDDERVAAATAHRDRMLKLARFEFLAEAETFKERKDLLPKPDDVKLLGLADFANAAKYHLLDAEARLARAKAR